MRIRSRKDGGVGGGSIDDSVGATLDAADASAFPLNICPEASAPVVWFWFAAREPLASRLLSSADGHSIAPSDAVSDSRSKRTFKRLPRLRDAVAGAAGVATQPPGGAGV